MQTNENHELFGASKALMAVCCQAERRERGSASGLRHKEIRENASCFFDSGIWGELLYNPSQQLEGDLANS